ncbi:uncharacterized protein EV154DRAFT_537510 [Mucor mucedo]|uniref:uncharacterized protein n=1 Tax=Mucor mucedo TaxID=29922 RepID=UPI00221EADDF|nr:uncharacterized protein EV154DRAFT_537510 [Mucor mucedo]KAI7892353.1 hypothetical protein EV154DRAFT_537510 [Mucor mucedo]
MTKLSILFLFNRVHYLRTNDRKYTPETNPPPPIPSTNALLVDRTLRTKELYSPIYADLHTNLPKSVMCFQDAPFPEDAPLFLHHEQVMKYLNELAIKEDLMPLIRFSTLVERVRYYENKVWKVTTSEGTTEDFDAVVVATGHYAVPYIPDIPGLDELNDNRRIQLLHSRDYRTPEPFKNKTVLVVGGGSSANDIVRETASVATKVYQSIRTHTELSRQAVERNPPNVQQISLISHIDNDEDISSVQLQDDVLDDVDVIIFGTGYLYSFPFLPFQRDDLIMTGQKVHHLNHYMFYKKNPTLCFLGLPIRVVPMPLMQRQSIVMARYWAGKIPMVPHVEMDSMDDARLDFVMGVAREIQYSEQLGAWAQGYTDKKSMEQWQSDDPVTGRLSENWIELRKNALLLRYDYLGY